MLLDDGIVDYIPYEDFFDEKDNYDWDASHKWFWKINLENINIVSAYIRMENPLVIDADGQHIDKVREKYNTQNIGKNFDGIIIKNVVDNIGQSNGIQDVHIVTDPNQIKAIDAESFCHETNINKSLKIN
jgi:hypothetical protein